MDIAAFETYARQLMAASNCPGLAVGLTRHGEPIYLKGFGQRSPEAAVTPDTIMGIASCTKLCTCIALLQLQEEGKLSVHDPVARFLPDLTALDPATTVHHLMTHSSGRPPMPTGLHASVRSILADPDMPKSPALQELEPIDTAEELIGWINRNSAEPLGAPGTYFSYSNEGYALLGIIIERVSGLSYAAYVTERILRPAGMSRSLVGTEGLGGLADVATLYTTRPGGGAGPAPFFWRAGVMAPTGGIFSTVSDLLRLLELFRTGGLVAGERLLREESVREMLVPHMPNELGHYGYGLVVRPGYHGVTLVGHNGTFKGTSAHFLIARERGLVAIALANLSEMANGRTALGLLNAGLDLPVETPRFRYEATECPPERLPLYEGRYASGEGAQVVVTTLDGRLLVGGTAAVPVGIDEFIVRSGGSEVFYRFLLPGPGKPAWAVATALRVVRRVG